MVIKIAAQNSSHRPAVEEQDVTLNINSENGEINHPISHRVTGAQDALDSSTCLKDHRQNLAPQKLRDRNDFPSQDAHDPDGSNCLYFVRHHGAPSKPSPHAFSRWLDAPRKRHYSSATGADSPLETSSRQLSPARREKKRVPYHRPHKSRRHNFANARVRRRRPRGYKE